MTEYILTLILMNAQMHGLDPYLVAGVIQQESSFNTQAVGRVGEIGLMQLRPEYFAENLDDENLLFDAAVNIALGTEYLGQLKHSCVHKDNNMFVICFNRGPTGARKVSNPQEDTYYKRVNAYTEQFRQQRIFEIVSE